jgi:hypothetical protein
MAATRKKLGAIAQAVALFVMSSAWAERGALAAERVVSTELEQVTVNMLDTAAMSTAMTSLVQKELMARAANTPQAAEVERMFPGFNGRVQSRVALEMRDTILHHIQDLRHQYEDLLRVSLDPEDVSALLHFQEDPIFSRLEDHALADSLDTAGFKWRRRGPSDVGPDIATAAQIDGALSGNRRGPEICRAAPTTRRAEIKMAARRRG